GGPDAAQVRLDALAAGEAALGLPAGSLLPTFQAVSGLGSGLSNFFSDALAAELGKTSANVILLDLRSLYNEVVSDPGSFGLLNVTGTACTTASSLRCTPDTLVDSRAPGLFLFADGAHPATAGHQLLADYGFSVIAAPALVANLAEASIGVIRSHQDLLLGRVRGGFGDGWSVFVAGSMGDQDLEVGQGWKADSKEGHLIGGVAHRLDPGWVVGGALDLSSSEVDFSGDMGSFEVDAVELSLFADYGDERLFGTLLGTLALSAEVDEVERLVTLGGGVRREQGDTSADLWAVKGVLGYRLWQRNGFSVGPFGSLNYQSVQVDGYREKGSRSTSMNFGSQDRDSFLLEGGLFADYSFGRTTLQGALSYEAELEDDARKLSAGLNSLPGSRFQFYGIEPSDYYWKFALGLESELAEGVSLGVSYQLRDGAKDNSDQQVNLGITLVL
ncbi:MAG TPA: autotransporter domain-containing protein, partial [Chromatiaceae bacterium]|nr:autotransporter domain-containing protein [Chromatiaceae bacterium]